MIKVVNIIPAALSGETNQDSEPNIAVNPANPDEIAISAFTPDPMGGPNAPIFVSTDGGDTWALNSIVPSNVSTGDITPRFAGGSRFYAGILRFPGFLHLSILRAASFNGATTMTVLVDRDSVDQPFVQAAEVPSGPDAGKDRVYVGINDFNATGGQTATVETSLDAAAATPTFTSNRIDRRGTGSAGQDGPQIRPAVHPDGTVYAVFYGWRAFGAGGAVTSDVVVVRDDNWASGATPFSALIDSADGIAGVRLATGVNFTFNGTLSQERLGGDLSIAVNPANSSDVYVAFCDVQGGAYTLHVRHSTDRGVTWSADLRTLSNTKNPALAINNHGVVGLAYQRVTGTGSSQRWETHLETTTSAFSTVTDMVLATVPAATPVATFLPYIGDYLHMMCHDDTFFGVFSANNTPDPANFPEGVTYLRNHDFATARLFAVNGSTVVNPSIDPFFFKYTPPLSITGITRITHFTRLTRLTPLTRLTHFTRITPFTRITRLTGLTRFTSITRFTRFTRLPPITRLGPIEPGVPESVQPFIRFGNTVFAPSDLDLARFEALESEVEALAEIGVTRLHQLAMTDPHALVTQLGYAREHATALVATAQDLLRGLAQ